MKDEKRMKVSYVQLAGDLRVANKLVPDLLHLQRGKENMKTECGDGGGQVIGKGSQWS